jgi:hypothetical protein
MTAGPQRRSDTAGPRPAGTISNVRSTLTSRELHRPTARPARAVPCLAALLALAVLCAGAPRAHGGDPLSPTDARERSLTADRHEAIRRGCKWLADNQSPGGAFGDDKAQVAITALSTLALMSAGSGISRGPQGAAVREGVRYLLALIENPPHRDASFPRGYFKTTNDNTSRMHGQGYATLALACALSSAVDDETEHFAPKIRRALQAAVHCAEDSQTATGGWGYDPSKSQEHEGSVTVTVAQGLRAAHDAGLRVSSEVVKAGLSYLRISQKSDGSFKYSIQQEHSTYALTAAAVSSFYLLGSYGADPGDEARIKSGIRYLERKLARQLVEPEWHYYGHFYAAWAAWQTPSKLSGSRIVDRWSEGASDDELDRTDFWGSWHTQVYPDLLRSQLGDGHWQDESDKFGFGHVLATAFAILTLAIPDELLPIFQR